MSDYPRSKDKSRGELEKLREMSFKEKLEYIWSYYNYYIIAAVAAILLIIGIFSACNSRDDVGLSLAWESPYIDYDELDRIEEALSKRLFDEESPVIVEASLFYSNTEDEAARANYERLLAMLSAGMIDVFVVDGDILKGFSAVEFVMPLDEMLGAIELQDPAAYGRISEELAIEMYGIEEEGSDGESGEGKGGEERIVGIRITDSPLLRELSINLYTDAYLCVAVSASNHDNTIRAIIEFFKETQQ